VLQIIAGAQHGLAEAMFERLGLALAATGMPLAAAVRRHSGRADRLRTVGISVDELPFSRHHERRTRRGVERLIDSFQPDLVVSWLARAARTVPEGAFTHLGVPGRDGRPRDFRGCGHLLLHGDNPVAPYLEAGWPAERVHRLPLLIRGRPAGPVARWSHTTPEDAVLMVSCGRLAEDGAGADLLDALDRLPPDFYLWVVGDGPGRPALEAEARARALDNRLRFLGWRHDTDSLLATADLFVGTAPNDRLGAEIIEAWAQARPVICVASPAARRLIRPGENGMLAPPGDGHALANAIERVADDRPAALHLALAGRQSYEAEFAESSVVEAYRGFFVELTLRTGSRGPEPQTLKGGDENG
jgi:glycosyltransferase involved in cell wall biosynthesis